MWKYYIEPPEEWRRFDETEIDNGVNSIFMKNSFQNIVPWWMRGMTPDRLVNLKLKFTAASRAQEEFERYNSKVRFNNHLRLNDKKKQAILTYRKLQTTAEELFTAANTVNMYGEKLHTAIDDGRFGPGYVALNRDVQDYINTLVMNMEGDSEEIRDDYFNAYNEEIRDSYITNYEKDTTPPYLSTTVSITRR